MNRGFLYGDGFFETIRVIDGKAPLLQFHLERIYDAIFIYKFTPQFDISEEFIQKIIRENTANNGLIRINFFRDGGGKYQPETDHVAFNHSYEDYSETFYLPTALDLKSELLKAPKEIGSIGTYPEYKPNVNWMKVKSLSSIYYVLAAKYKDKMNLNHLLIRDRNNVVCEELISNIIVLQNEELYFLSRENGGVNGATQRYLIDNYAFQLTEKQFTTEELLTSDAIFTCKGSTGIIRIQ